MNSVSVDRVKQCEVFSPLDLAVAEFLCSCEQSASSELFLAAALLSYHVRTGSTCLDMHTPLDTIFTHEQREALGTFPELSSILETLKKSESTGKAGDFKPLILDNNRLYLHRYWRYEEQCRAIITHRCETRYSFDNETALRTLFAQVFPPQKESIDWQSVAALSALSHSLCFITGGPGTGKTTTVAKIIALLGTLPSPHPYRIALAAPSGKAAARLFQSVWSECARIEIFNPATVILPEHSTTIHQLLGYIPGSTHFRHTQHTPLPYDCVIVDEGSMIDQALMTKLLAAVPLSSRLVILGDHDQLVSVEAGTVLSTICAPDALDRYSKQFRESIRRITGQRLPETERNNPERALDDKIVFLRHSYRFTKKSGIGVMSRAIIDAAAQDAYRIATGDEFPDIHWHELPSPQRLHGEIARELAPLFDSFLETTDPHAAHDCLDRVKILCALRNGPLGVTTVNTSIETVLRSRKSVSISSPWYLHRPLIINRNDYTLNLFNGDIGIILPSHSSDRHRMVYFRAPDGSMRAVLPQQLPEHETVYAMTVHKSQGSECDHAILLLPPCDHPLLSRELVYTAVTRARKHLTIWGRKEVFSAAINRTVRRKSGLYHKLWEK
jgi:exodeoxyribonuclease V alpha subunit